MKLFAFLPLLAGVWAFPTTSVEGMPDWTSTITSTTSMTVAPFETNLAPDCPGAWPDFVSAGLADRPRTTQTLTIRTTSTVYLDPTVTPTAGPVPEDPVSDYSVGPVLERDIDIHFGTVDIFLILLIIALL